MKHKKIRILTAAALLITAFSSAIMSGCTSMKVNKILKGLEQEDTDCPEYSLEKYTANYWEGNVIYNEAVMPLEEPDGSVKPIPLLYRAEKILSVRDSSLGTLYQEGKDYLLEDGQLVIPEGSSIKTVEYNQYYPPEDYQGPKIQKTDGSGYILWCDGFNLHQLQIAVTYIHVDKWEAAVPPAQGNTLSITLSKLEKKEPVKILIYGDSIASGCNSSSDTGDEPFAPKWYEMMEAALKKKYSYQDITIINTAVGGTDSAWGAQNAYNSCKVHEPDLAILAFGMNDIHTDPADFIENIRQIMDITSLGNYDCEFVLIAPMLANPQAGGFAGNQNFFREAMKNANWSSANHTVIADMTTFYEDLLARKRYWDMSCNNINHPNDFLARGYTQLMLRTLERES